MYSPLPARPRDSANCVAIEIKIDNRLRVLFAQIIKRCALNDTEEKLPLQRACSARPNAPSFPCCAQILIVAGTRSAFIKHYCDVAAERRLDFHRNLGRNKCRPAHRRDLENAHPLR
jgi:hypothetical protein